MRLAYSISGYKLPNQFRWLFEALWHPDDVFAIHIDQRTPDDVFKAMQDVTAGRKNVFFIEREPIIWMGMGLVRAEMRALSRLIDEQPDFDFLINLSMQDYPLKSRDDILAELQADPRKNYIRMLKLKEQPMNIRKRPYLLSFEKGDRLLKTPLPRLIPKSTPIEFKGSWWRVLSGEFCRWLVHADETSKYLDFLKNVQAPDELFFQNLIMASPYRETLADDYRHEVYWPGNSGSPDTVTMANMDTIAASSMWFVRKVDETIDPVLMEQLAKRIGAPVCSPEFEMV